MTDRHTYFKALEELCALETASPSEELLTSVCPHLNGRQVRDTLDSVTDDGRVVFVATPPLRVSGAFQIIAIDHPIDLGNGKRPPRLYWSHAWRLSDRSRGNDYRFVEEATAYAMQNWSTHLVVDRSEDFITAQLDDPAVLVKNSTKSEALVCPARMLQLHFTIDETWNRLYSNHYNCPLSQVIDGAILEITHYRTISAELRGGRGQHAWHYCWRCASALRPDGCPGCGKKFKDYRIPTGWSTPLPGRLVSYLQDSVGHQFPIHPGLARSEERRRWEEATRHDWNHGDAIPV